MTLENKVNNFTIAAVINKYDTSGRRVPSLQIITDFKDGHSNPLSTYDEKISLNENGQNTLDFSIIFKNNEGVNPFISLLNIGRELRVYWEEHYYYFVVIGRTPNFSESNIVFSFHCQDSFSYFLSKNNIGASFKDPEDALPSEWRYTSRTIRDLIINILIDSHLDNHWVLDANLEANKRGIADFPTEYMGVIDATVPAKGSLNLDNSNTYNALIEVANVFNGSLRVIYNEDPKGPHIITCDNKKFPRLTYHKLRPSVNLNQLNLEEKGDNFCTVLHVMGKEKEDGSIISLVPTITSNICKVYGYYIQKYPDVSFNTILGPDDAILAEYNSNAEKNVRYNQDDLDYFNIIQNIVKTDSSTLFNFDYFLESNQISPAAFNDLNEQLNHTYRDLNFKLQLVSQNYNELLYNYNSQEDQEVEIVSQIASLEEYKITSAIKGNLNNTVFINEKGQITADASAPKLNQTTIKNQINTKINESLVQLFNLWSNNYIFTHYQMGSTLFDKEIQNELIQLEDEDNSFIDMKILTHKKALDKVGEEYKTIYQQLVNIVQDPNIPEYDEVNKILIYKKHTDSTPTAVSDLQKNNFSAYSQYCNFKTKLERLALKMDKKYIEGNETFSVRGYENSYVYIMGILQELVNKASGIGADENSLIDLDTFTAANDVINKIISDIQGQLTSDHKAPTYNFLTLYNKYQAEQKICWDNILKRYGSYFIEGTFNDDQQMTSSDLYTTALAQFTLYNHPALSYSTEMIDWDLILNSGIEPPRVGDKITLFHEDYNLFNYDRIANRYIVVRFKTESYVGVISTINEVDCNNLLSNASDPAKGIFTRIQTLNYGKNNGAYYIDVKFVFNPSQPTITNVAFIKTINSIKVIGSEILCDEKSVVLNITGISKNLRKNSANLTVQNDLAMDWVVRKMLLNVRY